MSAARLQKWRRKNLLRSYSLKEKSKVSCVQDEIGDVAKMGTCVTVSANNHLGPARCAINALGVQTEGRTALVVGRACRADCSVREGPESVPDDQEEEGKVEKNSLLGQARTRTANSCACLTIGGHTAGSSFARITTWSENLNLRQPNTRRGRGDASDSDT